MNKSQSDVRLYVKTTQHTESAPHDDDVCKWLLMIHARDRLVACNPSTLGPSIVIISQSAGFGY